MPKTVKRRKNKLAGRYRNRWPDEAEISGRMIPKWVADSCRNRWPDHPEICISHGLRSIASTVLNEQGFDRDLVEAALAHVDANQVRSAYNRTDYLERRREMMQWWSDYIEQAGMGNLSVAAQPYVRSEKK